MTNQDEYNAAVAGQIHALAAALSTMLDDKARSFLTGTKANPHQYARPPFLTEEQIPIFDDFYQRTIDVVIKGSELT